MFSVVVPSLSCRKELLDKVLKGLKEQVCAPRFEVIVIKDKSPAVARNEGVKKAKGEFILFLGDDTIPHKRLLFEHSWMVSNDVVSVGLVKWHPKTHNNIKLCNLLGVSIDYSKIKTKILPYNYFCTANVCIAKKLLLKNKFDTDFKYAAMEDTELGYRLRYKVFFALNRKAIVYHYHTYDEQTLLKRQENIGKAISTLITKHPELKKEYYNYKIRSTMPLLRIAKNNNLLINCIYTKYKNIKIGKTNNDS